MASSERYVKREEICKVGNKTVYKAIDRSIGYNVALFEWNMAHVEESKRSVEMKKFISRLVLISEIRSDFILAMNTDNDPPFTIDPTETFVIGLGELMGSTLKSFLVKAGSVSVATIHGWGLQILKALEFLHTRTPMVILRTLKLENIFYDAKEGRLKIGDLCDAKIVTNPTKLPKSRKGDLHRMPPELIRGSSYDTKIDIWAFGLCLLEITTVQEPYTEWEGVSSKIESAISKGVLPHSLSKIESPQEIIEVIQSSLNINPTLRPTASQLLDAEFFKKAPANRDQFVSLKQLTEAEVKILFEAPAEVQSLPVEKHLTKPSSPEAGTTRLNRSGSLIYPEGKSSEDVILNDTDFLHPTHRTPSKGLRGRVLSHSSPFSSPVGARSNLRSKNDDIIIGDPNEPMERSRSPKLDRSVGSLHSSLDFTKASSTDHIKTEPNSTSKPIEINLNRSLEINIARSADARLVNDRRKYLASDSLLSNEVELPYFQPNHSDPPKHTSPPSQRIEHTHKSSADSSSGSSENIRTKRNNFFQSNEPEDIFILDHEDRDEPSLSNSLKKHNSTPDPFQKRLKFSSPEDSLILSETDDLVQSQKKMNLLHATKKVFSSSDPSPKSHPNYSSSVPIKSEHITISEQFSKRFENPPSINLWQTNPHSFNDNFSPRLDSPRSNPPKNSNQFKVFGASEAQAFSPSKNHPNQNQSPSPEGNLTQQPPSFLQPQILGTSVPDNTSLLQPTMPSIQVLAPHQVVPPQDPTDSNTQEDEWLKKFNSQLSQFKEGSKQDPK